MNEFKKRLKLTEEIKPKNNKKNYYIMYNEKKQKIGKIYADYEELQNNWLKGVSIFVITEDGKLVIEKRAQDTKLTPGQIDLCSGHRDNDEKGKSSAYRELKEELGIKKRQVLKLKKIRSEVPLIFKGDRKFFIQFYAGIIKQRKSNLELQEEEVSKIEEVPLEEGFELIREGKTKFPYFGREKEFEEIFEKITEFCKEHKNTEICL